MDINQAKQMKQDMSIIRTNINPKSTKATVIIKHYKMNNDKQQATKNKQTQTTHISNQYNNNMNSTINQAHEQHGMNNNSMKK